MTWDTTWPHRLAACGANVRIGHNVVFTSPERVWLGDNVRIDPFTYISGSLTTGDNVQICAGAVLGGRAGITLGSWTFVGYGSKLFTASEDYRYLVNEYWGACHVDSRPILFGDYAGVASDVIVMPGVTLKDGCRIGAKSFIYRSPEHGWAIYAGNPPNLRRYVVQATVLAEAEQLDR